MTHNSPENPLLAAWQETLARCGGAPAVFAVDGRIERRFFDIESEAGEFSARLADIAAGSVVGVQLGNRPSWPALLVALFRGGLIPLPLGGHMSVVELRLALETCGASALIAEEAGVLRVTRFASVGSQLTAPADFLKLTSGTTSAPRAIRFRAAQLVADCENICATMGITADDLNFGAIPISHSYGFSNLLTPLLCRGVPLVATEERLPRAIMDGLARTGATVFPGTPVLFQNLAELTDIPELPKLRLCISAGAPLTGAVAGRFAEKFSRKIHIFYGSSECGGIAYDTSLGTLPEEGFVGNALRGVSIRRPYVGERTPIEVRSAAVGDGYFPDDDPEVLGGGRFVPGDLARFTPRGLVLVGRASDVINIAGRKLNPLEVEQRLLACPGVTQAVVFGVPSRLRGEEAVAYVAGEGIDATSVLAYCQRELSAWQIPRDVCIVPEIPANERGKISRRALAEEYLKTRTP